MMRSTDGQLEMMTVNLTVSPLAGGEGAVGALRAHFEQSVPAGMQAHVTGSAGISVDYMNAILRGTDSTLLVTIVLVVVILLLVYRAPLAALVPLATIGVAYLVSRGVLGYLADAGWKISSLLDTFVVVLVFGVGTDYTIFLISRYREEVSKGDWHAASRTTVKRIGAVITASAATVIVGLGSMAFGQFGMIQTTGPALALTIFVTLLVALTLAPALLGIFGHYLFWPRHDARRIRRQRGQPVRTHRGRRVPSAGGRNGRVDPGPGDPVDRDSVHADQLRRDLGPAEDVGCEGRLRAGDPAPRQGQDHAGQRRDRDRPRDEPPFARIAGADP